MGNSCNLPDTGEMDLVTARQKYGKPQVDLPCGAKTVLLQSIELAQRKNDGCPVQMADILAEIQNFSSFPNFIKQVAHPGFIDLWRNDEVLCDLFGDQWSLLPFDGFECFSDRFERLHAAHYTLSSNLTMLPKKHLTVNFNWLKELLLSKDISRLDLLTELGSNPKFLDKSVDLSGQNICFASYPRTGNTMLRTFLEQCTGIHTGADMPLEITAVFQISGVTGEQHFADNSVWVTKSHYPWMGGESKFRADKIIYISRNPIDVFPSFAVLMSAASHSVTPQKPWNEY